MHSRLIRWWTTCAGLGRHAWRWFVVWRRIAPDPKPRCRLCVHVVKEHQMFRKREKEYNQSREGARLKSKRIEVALAARPPADMCLPC